jgi:transposase
MFTLIITARLNEVDPHAWLADAFARIAAIPQTRLHELLPWEWKRLNGTPAAAAAA